MRMRATAAAAVFALLASLLVAVSWSTAEAEPAEAAISGADFNPGLIITDSLFYDGSAMSADQVQTFLEQKVPRCAAGSICMKDAYSATPTMPAKPGLCDTFTGSANERVSSIIARVALACGISPKVLLVLIQKEQRLITSTAPTQRMFDKATGFACPDTAACDPYFSGFFYQVYYAAHQFKYYKSKPQNYSHKAGQVNNVRWHPIAACGSSPVYIQNIATASLYNYTPYQPNASALANLYSTGDDCASYGNRNFWTIYVGWFGSTTLGAGEVAIRDAYAAEGGAAGYLGAVVSTTCTPTAHSCSQKYANGSILWTSYTGAWPVVGAIEAFHAASVARGASIGAPTGKQVVVGNGVRQPFGPAMVYSSAAGTSAVYYDIQAEYTRLGGPLGSLGWPTAGDVCGLTGGGCLQKFQNATIYFGPGSGTFAVASAMDALYTQRGGPARMGYPRASATVLAGGSSQPFVAATMYSSAAGTFAAYGVIQTEFARLGGPLGALGWPTANDSCGLAGGGCLQPFQNGTVYYSEATGTHSVLSNFDAIVKSTGGVTGSLGYPTGPAATQTGGSTQPFNGGRIYASASGTFAVSGSIFSQYQVAGGPAGSLGWPTAAETCGTGGMCTQQFQNGTLAISAIQAFYKARGGAKAFGPTLGPEVFITGGSSQSFQGATIYSSAAGTFAVYGVIQTEYARLGGPLGTLGWPTANDTCGLAGGGCSQPFQNGTIYYGPTTGTYAVTPAVEALYRERGGPASSLGYPLASAKTVGTGTSQTFRSATVYSSSAGSFAVYGVIQTEYARLGGPLGTLGWPTANDTCGLAGGGCSQPFQNGTVYYGPTTGTYAVTPAVEALYRERGGPASSLGYPLASAKTVGTGTSQTFRSATVYSSSAGSFAVYGVIQTEYARLGGPLGTLGWPTANDTCGLAGGGCSQPFQNGTVYYGPTTGTYPVSGSILTQYTTAGGPGGTLGWPAGNESCTTAGSCTQRFQKGTLTRLPVAA